MLTVSLHGIKLRAPIGLYPEERILGNDFETDVDIWLSVQPAQPWPFVDYTIIQAMVTQIFQQPAHLLETVVQSIHTTLRQQIPDAEKIRVAVRKLNPPMPGEVAYAQVCYEA